MIARATHWRHGQGCRETVAAAGAVTSLEALVRNGATSGKITSRPGYTAREIELIAFRLGVTVVAVKRAIDLGLLDTLNATR
jgi:hypothetical protein